MPEQPSRTIHTACWGFMITGNFAKYTVEAGEHFQLDAEPNKFGAGRRMVTVSDMSGEFMGYVTEGQAEIIRNGGA